MVCLGVRKKYKKLSSGQSSVPEVHLQVPEVPGFKAEDSPETNDKINLKRFNWYFVSTWNSIIIFEYRFVQHFLFSIFKLEAKVFALVSSQVVGTIRLGRTRNNRKKRNL